MEKNEICYALGLKQYPSRVPYFGARSKQVDDHMEHLARNSGALIRLSRKDKLSLSEMGEAGLFNGRANNIRNTGAAAAYEDALGVTDEDFAGLQKINNFGPLSIATMRITTEVYRDTDRFKLVPRATRPAEVILKELLERLDDRTRNVYLDREMNPGRDTYNVIAARHRVSPKGVADIYYRIRNQLQDQLGGYGIGEALAAYRPIYKEQMKSP